MINIEKIAEAINPLIQPVEKLINRIFKTAFRNTINDKLKEADISISATEFIGIKLIFSLVCLCVGALIIKDFLTSIVLILVGWFFFDIWLKEKIKQRKQQFIKVLPDSLDILTICVEAGLTFDNAVLKMVEVIKDNPLKADFMQFIYEVKVGKTRRDALKNMAKKVNIPEFSSFISSVIQSDVLGVSLASSLRTCSEEIRIKKRQRAEKLALEAPVKLLFPLIIFIFPTTFIVIFAPIILELMKGL